MIQSIIAGSMRNKENPVNNSETRWDKLLRIKTFGRDDSRADQYRYLYEPTRGSGS